VGDIGAAAAERGIEAGVDARAAGLLPAVDVEAGLNGGEVEVVARPRPEYALGVAVAVAVLGDDAAPRAVGVGRAG